MEAFSDAVQNLKVGDGFGEGVAQVISYALYFNFLKRVGGWSSCLAEVNFL